MKSLNDAITKHGYPASADANQINYPMTVLLLFILVIYVTMVYGPIAAWLVELFPTRIRYTGMSLPYHIGNGWFGGFLPATVFAIVAATGNIYSGLWYPIIVAAMSFVVALIFLPETKDRDINQHLTFFARTQIEGPVAQAAGPFALGGEFSRTLSARPGEAQAGRTAAYSRPPAWPAALRSPGAADIPLPRLVAGRRVSSAVEQRFCKPLVGGSSPSPGTSPDLSSPG